MSSKNTSNNNQSRDEQLIIDNVKVDLLKRHLELIWQLFAVRVLLQSRSHVKQWISFSGTSEKNRNNAKKFVISLCNPDFTQQLEANEQLIKCIFETHDYHLKLMKKYLVYLCVKHDEQQQPRVRIQGSLLDVQQVIALIETEKKNLALNSIPHEDSIICLNDDNDDTIEKSFHEKVSLSQQLQVDTDEWACTQTNNKPKQTVATRLDSLLSSSTSKIPLSPSCQLANSGPAPKKKHNETIVLSSDDEEDIVVQKQPKTALLNEYVSQVNSAGDATNKLDTEAKQKAERMKTLLLGMNDTQQAYAMRHVYDTRLIARLAPPANSENKPQWEQQDFIPLCTNTKQQQKNSAEKPKPSVNNNQQQQQMPTISSNTVKAPTTNPPPLTNQLVLANNNITNATNKRYIVIDGSNVAVSHGLQLYKKRVFSCKGIKIAIDEFLKRGHTQITAALPQFRRGRQYNSKCPTVDPEILDDLESQGYISYTPSRYVDNQLICPYDDRFILRTAEHYNAIIVSNDNYRDLVLENPAWKKMVNERLLQYTFIGDLFLIADDPLGRYGPKLDDFLSLRPASTVNITRKPHKKFKKRSKSARPHREVGSTGTAITSLLKSNYNRQRITPFNVSHATKP